MFQYLRAGNTAVFGDVSDDEYRYVGLFGKAEELSGRFAHLRYAPRCRVDLRRVQRLDGVNDHQVGRYRFHLREYICRSSFGEDVAIGLRGLGNPFRAHFELLLALFARNIQRSEEHTFELQSLMRLSYAVF